MTTYLDELESIRYWLGDDRRIVETIAGRYIGASPPIPFVLRASYENGILQDEEGLFDMNMNDRLPEARLGDYAYLCGLVWGETGRSVDLRLRCLGPVRLYVNGKLLYRSTVTDEIKKGPDAGVLIGVDFAKGWNTLVVKVRKTAAGFGCLLGTEEAKVRILNVLAPFTERSGQAGWVHTEALREDSWQEGAWPDLRGPETETGLVWYPQREWPEEKRSVLPCERMFGLKQGKSAYAWSRLKVPAAGGTVRLSGYSAGPITVWLNGIEVMSREEAGDFVHELPAFTQPGDHDVLIRTTCGAAGWGFQISASIGKSACEWVQPHPVRGTDEKWLYAGPFDQEISYTPDQLRNVRSLFRTKAPKSQRGDSFTAHTYWQLDGPGLRVRPFYENALLSSKWTTSGVTNFARWDYPLGVTMYGLLQTGRLLGRRDMVAYAEEHIKLCTDMYEYSLWDKERYGFPAVNQQLVMMRMLDNCGSFGSAMLEAYKESRDPGYLAVADVIADFIHRRLERKADGAYYRVCAGEYSENTLWADDLYMSTPFLVRYYQITGKREYLDDAAKQFILYKKYLFMPEWNVMSHVYDFKYNTATYIPWGRGNGWCLFSLSEILAVLPEEHPDRPAILDFYNEMCEGVAALQCESGLWRQVLNDPDAYEEASCTAMFTYAFARGVRHGWLRSVEPFYSKALRGWEGLTSKAIDRHGNVYGVCSGSRYAFHAEYYKEDLRTVTNDNHGIGIMMLAGIEICKLTESRERSEEPHEIRG
ncbi:glycoside hydrolase family 88 protein [Paenibacillus sp. GD4]|uniref:glycoside hydrolase family 88/105 protein n=1 Tax=Paenibacillus sp. GD4 TaxID=3068890 RepID=UPI002796CBBB|nr:glycoside hydrolase family 88 protein [Paenibacillus sp. GD4]MDQ1909645.1 glycoside hydrolase family 88 protein [Paenibacillus sp. GD4]